jgi:hypothetical protein
LGILGVFFFFFFLKKKKKRNRGVAGATPWPKMGWSGHPFLGKPPTSTPRPLGVVRPPPTAQIKPVSFFFLGGLSGWLDHPHTAGSATHPLAKNGVVWPPHFWARGGSSHPAIPPFFFFFLNFNSFFFSKKKKKKT